MAKILVLYYSSYGHVETMAHAVAEARVRRRRGRRETRARDRARGGRAQVRVTSWTSPHRSRRRGAGEYDAIIIGIGTRFGRMASQMATFLDRPAASGSAGRLNGKVGSAFTSTATQHGGQETTLFSIITNLLHFGMVIVGLPYSHKGMMTLNEVVGGSPYGATTIAGNDGSRLPSAIELEGARYQGQLVGGIAAKLFG